MSQDNVALVRRIFDGWSRGDFAVGADLVAEDFEWRQHDHAVEPGSLRHGGIGDGLRRIFEIYENFRLEPEEFIDAGSAVVVVARARATARGSGAELDQHWAFVWTVRDGLLVRNEVYGTRDEALEAARRRP